MKKRRSFKKIYTSIKKQPTEPIKNSFFFPLDGVRHLHGTYRPVCTNGHGYLGECMSYDAAWDKAFAHQKLYKHTVNAENC